MAFVSLFCDDALPSGLARRWFEKGKANPSDVCKRRQGTYPLQKKKKFMTKFCKVSGNHKIMSKKRCRVRKS